MRRPAHAPVDVVVAIPARDEQDRLGRCLRSVLASIRHARRRGHVAAAVVTVVAHQCSDATAEVARQVLLHEPGSAVLTLDRPAAVGEVRDMAVRHGLHELGSEPVDAWVLSTDADTVVPRTWVSSIVAEARRSEAVCVVGMADLDAWYGDAQARQAYDEVLAAKLYGDDEHGHVYGANLAVRADAYLAIGGFPRPARGEDQELVDALAAAGHALLRTRRIRVVTSGRTHGRAAGGLADLLHGLHAADASPPYVG